MRLQPQWVRAASELGRFSITKHLLASLMSLTMLHNVESVQEDGSLGSLFWSEVVRVAGLSNAQLLEALEHDVSKAAHAALPGRTQSAEQRCVALHTQKALRQFLYKLLSPVAWNGSLNQNHLTN